MHHTLYQYNINKTMCHKLKFFCNKLKLDSGIEWETLIMHLIPCMLFAMMIGDSFLDGAGGFLIALRFWWHLRFPDKVIQQKLCFERDNADGMLILISILEFVTMIIKYCATLHIIKTTPITEILLIQSSSTSRTIYPLQTGLSTCANVPSLVACLLVSSVYC